MSKTRIKQNFYTAVFMRYEKIPDEEYKTFNEKQLEYLNGSHYWYVRKELPDGRLYAGWGDRYPTKLTKDDLPPDYIRLSGNKKNGYIRTAGVKDLFYKPSKFHNHTFKDDFLLIKYSEKFSGADYDDCIEECDEYIFGNDIVDFIAAVDKWSPEYDTSEIKQSIVEQYNLFCDEMNERPYGDEYKKIDKFEDLL